MVSAVINQEDAGMLRELKEAFDSFSEVSEHLTFSHEELNQTVHQLQDTLGPRQPVWVKPGDEHAITQYIEQILDALPAGVVVISAAGNVAHDNQFARALLGEPLVGLLWRDVIDRAFVSMQGDEVSLKDGRLVNISTCPLGSGSGQVVMLEDVTEKRLMQDMLNRQQRLSTMGEMLASLAHQIRTPLASSLLYVSQLNQLIDSPLSHERCAEKIISRLKHLDNIVNDMLVFARGGTVGHEMLSVSEFMIELEQLIEPQVARCECDLKMIDCSNGMAMSGNKESLLGVFLNILNNAIEAGCHQDSTETMKGIVEMKVTAHETEAGIKTLEFVVSDNGPGIPDAIIKRLFEPFFTTKSQGTGLGLSVVQAVVQSHGGVVRIQPRTDSLTRVQVRLPAIHYHS